MLVCLNSFLYLIWPTLFQVEKLKTKSTNKKSSIRSSTLPVEMGSISEIGSPRAIGSKKTSFARKKVVAVDHKNSRFSGRKKKKERMASATINEEI